ncbi:uncharacterized protein LOC142333173 isoform X2 [Lycorma delicatula]|uniref:uncharacterized protein LOC142333173 isoform X2 n=1 Tax=Lycorma delicatula TaxID=130591 RepID=UPI003F515E1A
MRILLYVMSFFIFSAESVPLNKWPFISTKFNQHEKYPNLQNSCISMQNKDGFVDYIKGMYKEIHICFITKLCKRINLESLKKHKYYDHDVIKLTIFEKHLGENEVKLLPTLLKLLNVIPDTIIKKDSIVSGIDITETISTDATNSNQEIIPTDAKNSNKKTISTDAKNRNKKTSVDISSRVLYNVRSPKTSKYGSLEYVIMDRMNIYAYINCKSSLQDKKDKLRNSETEKEIYKKIEIPCTLRLNTRSITNNFFEQLTPVLNINEENLLKYGSDTYVQFELQFSYICKFVSPLQVFSDDNILQYKILNFTVSGYHFKKNKVSKSEFFGLTYCLQHQNIDNYDYDLEDDFFYNLKL